MKIELTIRNLENIGKASVERYQEIFEALVASGGLDGVKGGKTIIHFDADGTFQGVQLDYWPFRRRKKE